MEDLADKRQQMVERQIVYRGIADIRVLDAMRSVPREEFVPEHLREFSYDDVPLPIEEEQTISQPYIVALMLAAAEIAPGDRVGLPEAAPFDVIIAAAGAPDIPQTWREQLAIGGRLVLPVGDSRHRQQLVKITRSGEDEYTEEELGAVMFVPQIGTYGWDAAND